MNIYKRSNGIYHIRYSVNGKEKSISTKTKKKSEALKFLSNFNEEMKRRDELEYTPISLKKFCFEYLKYSEVQHTEKTHKTYKTTFKYLQEFFGQIELIDISFNDIEDYITYRMKNPSVYQARKDYINISSALNWAIRKEFLIKNPCKKVRKPKPPEKMPLFYSKEEYEILINHIKNDEFRDLVMIAVNTGLRQMELICLAWRQINLAQRIIILDNSTHITKSKKVRMIPMNKNVHETLSKKFNLEKPMPDSFVFAFPGITNRWRYVQNNMRSNVRGSGLNPKLNFHSLRHTFASWLVQKGVSIYQVSKLLGHSDIKVTQIYSHLNNEVLSESVNRLCEKL